MVKFPLNRRIKSEDSTSYQVRIAYASSSSTFLPITRLLEFNLGEPQRSGRPYGHMENLYSFQVGRDMFLNQSWAIIIHLYSKVVPR